MGSHVVLGNEAADADSIVAAIAAATLANDGSIPVAQCRRDELRLRPDALALIQLLAAAAAAQGERIAPLTTIEEMEQRWSDVLQVTLVDHNVLSTATSHLSSRVIGIIDHHADGQGVFPALKPGAKTLAPVGSCCTLVAERHLAQLVSGRHDALRAALLRVVLLDTVLFDIGLGKTTARDIAVAHALLPPAVTVPPTVAALQSTLAAEFAELQRIRFDVSSLTAAEVLAKDYKEWAFGEVTCGVAAIMQSGAEFLGRPDCGPAIQAMMKDRSAGILLLMHVSEGPNGFTRELGIVGHEEHRRTCSELAVALNGGGLRLESSEMGSLAVLGLAHSEWFRQHNATASRKQVQPLLARFFASS